MNCDLCESGEAELMIGNMQTGEQLAVCTGCSLGWALSRIDQLLPDDARRLVALKIDPSLEAALKEAGAPSGGRKRRQPAAPADAQPHDEPAPQVAPQAAPDDG